MTDGKKSLSQPVELREILHYGISLVRAARRSLKAYGKNLQHIKALYTRALLITVETSDKQPPRGGESGGGAVGRREEEGGQAREEEGEMTSSVISFPACWHHACSPSQRTEEEVFKNMQPE